RTPRSPEPRSAQPRRARGRQDAARDGQLGVCRQRRGVPGRMDARERHGSAPRLRCLPVHPAQPGAVVPRRAPGRDPADRRQAQRSDQRGARQRRPREAVPAAGHGYRGPRHAPRPDARRWPVSTLLLPDSELVASGWLAAIPGWSSAMVGTTLPRLGPNGPLPDWATTGFVTVVVVGGTP